MPTIYNKVTVNNDTLIDLSGDTVASAADIVAGKVGHLNTGATVTGTATVGADVPIFIVTWDSNYTQVLSVTCNKTYAEISAGYYTNGPSAIVRETNDGSYYSIQPASMQEPTQGSDITFLVFLDTAGASYDIVCHPNGTFSATNPSSYYTTLNITENGTYQQQEESHQIIKQVNVNVSSNGSSVQTKTGTFSGDGSRDITFSCEFEPDVIYWSSDPGTSSSTGNVAGIIVRGMMAATRYRNNNTINSHYAQLDITDMNTAGSSYSFQATYDSTNEQVTLYCWNSNARTYFVNGRTYSFKCVKYT